MKQKVWHWGILVASLVLISGIVCAVLFVFMQAGSVEAALPLFLLQTHTSTSLPSTASQIPSTTFTPFQPATATATFTVTLTPTPTDTPTPTFTPIPPTNTPVPTDTPVPIAPPPEGLPSEAYITNITGYPQIANLDCEARSAVDLAAYFGVSISEDDFISQMPLSDNPDEGFVGNIYDEKGQIPPASYGVHAAPVASLLRAYGLNAWDYRWMDFETLQREVAAGRPVMVWVIGNVWSGSQSSYTSSSGATTIVAAWEHTVLVIGYDPEHVTVLDGNLIYEREIYKFLDSWSVLGNMGILVE